MGKKVGWPWSRKKHKEKKKCPGQVAPMVTALSQ